MELKKFSNIFLNKYDWGPPMDNLVEREELLQDFNVFKKKKIEIKSTQLDPIYHFSFVNIFYPVTTKKEAIAIFIKDG